MADIRIETSLVSLTSLKPYPKNARIGDVDAIAKSLEVNGQYRPIVVNKNTNEILAGNHTWKAAKQLGWKKIAVSFVDVTDREAQRIVLADNRTHDLGMYDNDMLAELLRSLPDLEGTGYTEWDIENLDGLYSSTSTSSGESKESENSEPDGASADVGTYYRNIVEREAFTPWAQQVVAESNGNKKNISRILRKRLGFPEQSPFAEKKKGKVAQSDLNISIQAVSRVPIESLQPYPDNAREGDVGAISESLRVNGQYRPIVVNKRDNIILVGNHTWMAAQMLGWTEIGVVYVDVDDIAARKIVLADNRTAELGHYDEKALLDLIVSLGSFEGTGWDGDDVDTLISTVNNNGVAREKKIFIAVGEWMERVSDDEYTEWEKEVQSSAGWSREEVCREIIRRLNLPADAYTMNTTTPQHKKES